MRYYFVSLGSNIEAKRNVVRMLVALLKLSPEVAISSIAVTNAEGMPSNRPFLNLVVRIKCALSATDLKQQFNKIELALGRDRSDPLKKIKDRTADLDILFSCETSDFPIAPKQIPEAPYVRPFLLELLDFLGIDCSDKLRQPMTGVSISFGGMTIGEKPMIINASTTIDHDKLLKAPLNFTDD